MKVILQNQAKKQNYYFILEIIVNAQSLDVCQFSSERAPWSDITDCVTWNKEILSVRSTDASLIFFQRSTCRIISFRTTTLAGFLATTLEGKRWKCRSGRRRTLDSSWMDHAKRTTPVCESWSRFSSRCTARLSRKYPFHGVAVIEVVIQTHRFILGTDVERV